MTRLSKLMYAALLALTLSAPALAADSGRVPLPNIPEAKGEKCVEPEDVMRRNHMDYLKAHRDETMRQGIRTTKYSLKACLECHAADEAKGEEVVAGKEKAQGHFCQNCHQYAGVKIDCFECHATKPEGNASMHPVVTPGMEAMKEAHEGSGAMLNAMAGAEKGAAK
jgi:hypothetical protein